MSIRFVLFQGLNEPKCPPQDEEGAVRVLLKLICGTICSSSDTNLNTLNSVTQVKLLGFEFRVLLYIVPLRGSICRGEVPNISVPSCFVRHITLKKKKTHYLKKEIEVRKERRT